MFLRTGLLLFFLWNRIQNSRSNSDFSPKCFNADQSNLNYFDADTKCFNADTTRVFEGKVVNSSHGHFLTTFNPKINVGEIIQTIQLKLAWRPTFPGKTSKSTFEMISYDIKGKRKGFPLDSKNIKYKEEGNYTFDVTTASWSNTTSFFGTIETGSNLCPEFEQLGG